MGENSILFNIVVFNEVFSIIIYFTAVGHQQVAGVDLQMSDKL